MTLRGAPLAFYLAHIDDDTDQCLTWPFGASKSGYGMLWLDGRMRYVHVLVCERHHGPRPAKMDAAHAPVICHNKLCINWRHLRWATRQQNSDDMLPDESRPFGEQRYNAKLTWEEAAEIHARYMRGGVTQTALAADYGVAQGTIWQVVHDKTWRVRD